MAFKIISNRDKDGNFVVSSDAWTKEKIEELFDRYNPNRKLRLEREEALKKEADKK
ncbi:hypothetical protein OZX68_02245 [Streptococcaceae bacterium ESL0729]|nr:hypothetical protein OZX68_02245 [Streptococcaceae bacterium ESL0729]